MLVFLALNGVEISSTQEELVEVGLALANGSMNAYELFAWLSKHNL